MRSILMVPSAKKALFFSFIQQVVVASSTLWIANLSSAAVAGSPMGLWLGLFVASLTVVYLPSSLMVYFLEKTQFEGFLLYIERFSHTFYLKPKIRTHTRLREERQPFLTSEAWLVVSDSIKFLNDWVAVAMNVTFGIVVLGLAVDLRIIAAYAVTVPLVTIVLLGTSRAVDQKAEAAQGARTRMMESLRPAWDSVLTGNAWTFSLWKTKFAAAQRLASQTAVRSVVFSEVITALAMFLSLVPVLGTILWLLSTNSGHPAVLAVIVATLPRHILTIQHLSTVVQLAIHWRGVKTRITGLETALRLPEDSGQLNGRVSWGAITAQMPDKRILSLDSAESLTSAVEAQSTGRVTLRGGNGSGKSTLMALLKSSFSEKAFLLPAHSDLIFMSTEGESLSTGQKHLRILDELRKHVSAPVLLLDEWDANLDAQNMSEASERIDALAQVRLVIEVRHRE